MNGVGHLEDALFDQGQLFRHALRGVVRQCEGIRPSCRFRKVHFLHVVTVSAFLQTHGKPGLHACWVFASAFVRHSFQSVPLKYYRSIILNELNCSLCCSNWSLCITGTSKVQIERRENCDPAPVRSIHW